jgi:WD40 repeat protein
MYIEAHLPGCNPSTVKVVQVNAGACIHELPIEAGTLAFSPDGCRLFMYPMDIYPSTLGILELASGVCEDLRLPDHFVADYMAILPDHTTIVTAAPDKINFWDLEALGMTVGSPLRSDPQHLDDNYQIERFAISPSGRFIVTSSADRNVPHLWCLPQGTFERTLAVDLSMGTSDWSFSPVCDISIETEAFILSFDTVAHIWFLEGTENQEIKHPDALKLPMGDLCLNSIRKHKVEWFDLYSDYRPFKVSLSNGRMAAVSFDDTVEVSELGVAPNLFLEFKTPGEQRIETMSLSPNSKYLAISYGTTMRIWNLAATSTHYEFQTHGGVQFLAFSPDESLLVCSTSKSIWSLTMMSSQNARCLLQKGLFEFLWKPCFSFSSSRKIIACLVTLLPSGVRRVFLWDTSSGLRLPDFEISYQAARLSFSKDDRILYALGDSETLETYEFEEESSPPGPMDKFGLNYDTRIDVTTQWIYRHRQKFLKIPFEYAPYDIAYSSNYLAFSIQDKGVLVLDLN